MIQLIQQQGKTILFSSHILSDVERVVDRIAVIDKAKGYIFINGGAEKLVLRILENHPDNRAYLLNIFLAKGDSIHPDFTVTVEHPDKMLYHGRFSSPIMSHNPQVVPFAKGKVDLPKGLGAVGVMIM